MDRWIRDPHSALRAQAHWSCDDAKISILIGHDAETWDIGFWMPELVLAEIETEIAREHACRR